MISVCMCIQFKSSVFLLINHVFIFLVSGLKQQNLTRKEVKTNVNVLLGQDLKECRTFY